MNKTQYIENSNENLKQLPKESKVTVKNYLRRSILAIFISSLVVPPFANSDIIAVTSKSKELQELIQSVQEKEGVEGAIEQDFDHDMQARDTFIFPSYTQKFAEYQDIQLSKDFFINIEQDKKNFKSARADLYQKLSEGRNKLGKDYSQTIDKFFIAVIYLMMVSITTVGPFSLIVFGLFAILLLAVIYFILRNQKKN